MPPPFEYRIISFRSFYRAQRRADGTWQDINPDGTPYAILHPTDRQLCDSLPEATRRLGLCMAYHCPDALWGTQHQRNLPQDKASATAAAHPDDVPRDILEWLMRAPGGGLIRPRPEPEPASPTPSKPEAPGWITDPMSWFASILEKAGTPRPAGKETDKASPESLARPYRLAGGLPPEE